MSYRRFSPLAGYQLRKPPLSVGCETKTPDPPTTSTTTSKAPITKLTRAQQIRALEEAMEDEERATYLDARDMGSDFWSAGA